jgi:hypothetical protein
LAIALTDPNGAVSLIKVTSRTGLIGVDGPLKGLPGRRRNSRITFQNGYSFAVADIDALNAFFQMAAGYP